MTTPSNTPSPPRADSPKTVLVIEDDASFRHEVTQILRGAGFRCETADNGLQALREGLRKGYDLIVTDIEMPGIDGLKVVSRVKLAQNNQRTPVIVVSGANHAATVLQAKALGVDAYLLKPIVPGDLLAHALRLTGPPPPFWEPNPVPS